MPATVFGRKGLTAAGRVAVAVVAVLAIGVAGVVTIAYVGVVSRASSQLDESLVHEVEAYTAAVSPRTTNDTRTLAEASRAYLAARVGQGGLAPILLVRFEDGRVLSNSELKLEDIAENRVALDTATARSEFGTIDLDGTTYRTLTAPVLDAQDQTVAAFQVAVTTSELDQIFTDLAISLTLAGIAVILLAAAISARVARTSLRPLRAMAQTASQVSQATLGERIGYIGPDDELDALATAIDSMLDRLEKSFAEQRRFVADASHELRTPVAVMRGNLDLLRTTSLSAEEREESLRILDDEVSRMQRLLVDLLSLASTSSPQRRPFQPLQAGLLLHETAARIRTLGERDFVVSCENEVWVNGDPDLLEQALQNIARNAVEHTSPGDRVALVCRSEGAWVEIEISDSGPGIPAEDLPRIFDRFYRSYGPRPEGSGGSGLGLAIAKRLIELHGGTISVANAEDAGAVFTIRLPAIEPPADEALAGSIDDV